MFFRLSKSSLLILLALGCWLAGPGFEANAESRVFTNKDGQKIEAELLQEKGGFLKIRRISDSAEFVIEVNSLSLDDQLWLSNRGKRPPRYPGVTGWQELAVWLPTPRDEIMIVGCASRVACSVNGANEYRLLLPVGAWVHIWVRSSKDPGRYISHLVQYEGAKKWKFTDDGYLLYLSRDDQPRKIVGISPQPGDGDDYFRQFDPAELDDEICIDLPEKRLPDGLSILGENRVTAFTCDQVLKAGSLAALAQAKPKAVALTVYGEDLPSITEFEKLDALQLWAGWPRPKEDKDGRTDFLSDKLVLAELPKVTDLELTNIPFHEELGQALIALKTVRMLDFRWNSPGVARIREHPDWENIAELAPTLESLRLGPRITAQSNEIEKLHKLRVVSLSSLPRSQVEENFFLPEKMNELLVLETFASSVEQEQLQLGLAAAYFPKIRRVASVSLFPMDTVPQLDTLQLRRPDPEEEKQNVADLASQKELRLLSLSDASQEDLALLSTLPCAKTIEYLSFYDGTFTDLAPLGAFPNLKTLALDNSVAAIDTFDLALFPGLTRLRLYDEQGLLKIEGLMEHQNLTAISLRDNPKLKSLGSFAPNAVLQSVYISRCPALKTLSTFAQTTGLTHVDFLDCDSLDGSLDFLKQNPLRDLDIKDCEQLDNRSVKDIGK